MLCAILANIAGIKPVGQHAVRLQRADLPCPPDCVGQMPFELRRIECALAGQFFPAIFGRRKPRLDNRVAQFAFGLVPIGIAAKALFGPQCELYRIFEAEVLVDAVSKLTESAHFLDHLIFAAKDMRVVLRKLADAHDAVQRAMRFVAVATAIFVKAQRQVAIAFDALPEHKDVRRAVHRLQRHPVGIFCDRRRAALTVRHDVGHSKHVFGIFAPMARGFPLADIHQLRRLDLAIAGAGDGAAHIILQRAPDDIAFGMPEDRSMRFGLQMEQVHVLPQPPVVAFGGFLQPHQVRIELLFVQPAGAINAAELRIILVAAPIGARDAHQLERLRIELAGRREMRPAAHVHPVVARPIDRQFLALG